MWFCMRRLSVLPAVDKQSIVLLKVTDSKTYFSHLKEGSPKEVRTSLQPNTSKDPNYHLMVYR